MSGGCVPERAVPENKVVSAFPGIKVCEFGLLWRPGAVGLATQCLNFVMVGYVLLTVQRRRWFGPELVSALDCETRDGAQPWSRHGRARRRRRGLVRGRRAPHASRSVSSEWGRQGG